MINNFFEKFGIVISKIFLSLNLFILNSLIFLFLFHEKYSIIDILDFFYFIFLCYILLKNSVKANLFTLIIELILILQYIKRIFNIVLPTLSYMKSLDTNSPFSMLDFMREYSYKFMLLVNNNIDSFLVDSVPRYIILIVIGFYIYRYYLVKSRVKIM